MVRGFDIVSIDKVKKMNHEAGQYFFSPDAMKFFKSQVSDCAWGYRSGYLFYSSEKPPTGPRTYRINFCNEHGRISKVGDRVGSKREAESTIKALLKGEGDETES